MNSNYESDKPENAINRVGIEQFKEWNESEKLKISSRLGSLSLKLEQLGDKK